MVTAASSPFPLRLRALAALASSASLLVAQDEGAATRPLPSLAAATRIWDCAAGAERTWDELLDRLAGYDAVFLGETHVDDTTHRVEAHVLDELLRRRDGKVVLTMEMFERDVQPVLDGYLAGHIDEASFVRDARAWNNYATAYRPLVEAAKAAGIPVVAANFPGSLRRRLGSGGKAAFAALSPDERALLPDEILPAGDRYWERVARAVRGHMGFGAPATAEERLWDTQNLWDNAMGDNVARALAAHPGHLVLHVAGGFHVAWHDGTFAQFQRRAPGASAAVVSILPTAELFLARPQRDADQADFLVYAATIARGEFEGTLAVEVPAELRYRLHLPSGASAAQPAPLLVWLPDRGERAEDALALWQNALGSAVAVAVVEQPFPAPQEDRGGGGAWQSGDGFRADYGRAAAGVVRLVEYATRRLPIDPRRVLVAGAGSGGAAVMWTALYGEWFDGQLLAIDPDDQKRLAMEALPDRPPSMQRLVLGSRDDDTSRFDKTVADYRSVGAVVDVAGSLQELTARVTSVRKWLAVPDVAAARDANPVWVALDRDLPRARQWAEIHAARLIAAGRDARVVTADRVPADAPADAVQRMRVGDGGCWSMATFEDGTGLPLAGGSFGGTTVVVLPAGASDAVLAAWQSLEQKRAIKRRSMFANLAVARLDGSPTLPSVIADLRQRGRNRVLLVPAQFCADAETMRAIGRALGDAADGMDLNWLPGLGAELVR